MSTCAKSRARISNELNVTNILLLHDLFITQLTQDASHTECLLSPFISVLQPLPLIVVKGAMRKILLLGNLNHIYNFGSHFSLKTCGIIELLAAPSCTFARFFATRLFSQFSSFMPSLFRNFEKLNNILLRSINFQSAFKFRK